MYLSMMSSRKGEQSNWNNRIIEGTMVENSPVHDKCNSLDLRHVLMPIFDPGMDQNKVCRFDHSIRTRPK